MTPQPFDTITLEELVDRRAWLWCRLQLSFAHYDLSNPQGTFQEWSKRWTGWAWRPCYLVGEWDGQRTNTVITRDISKWRLGYSLSAERVEQIEATHWLPVPPPPTDFIEPKE